MRCLIPYGVGHANMLPTMIAASKVNGTKVYSRTGQPLGRIYDVMLDQESGYVTYTVMSFGGFSRHRRKISSGGIGSINV